MASRRGAKPSESRLIEFPKKPRVTTQNEESGAQLPAWRVELNEKVRAVKARRNGLGAESPDPVAAERHAQEPSSARPSAAREQQPINADDLDLAARTEPDLRPMLSSRAGQRQTDAIVEAALTRVRRASLPKIQPSRPVQPGPSPSLSLDREATARALEPTPEVRASVSPVIESLPEIIARPIERPVAHPARADVDDLTPQLDERSSAPKVLVLDEIEPRDYLEAEIRKVSQHLVSSGDQRLPLFTLVIINLVDLATLAISCLPFLAVIVVTGGDLSSTTSRVAVGVLFAMIAFFYFALTQCLCGRTFGMMVTSTRLLDQETLEGPTPSQSLVRTAGYFLAAAPALLGLLWAFADARRRGLHDRLSGTLISRDI